MTEAALAQPSLEIKGILRETWALYRDLFVRSVLAGLLAFSVLGLLDATSASGRVSPAMLVLALVLPVAGTALVQGALVNAVDDDRKSRPRKSIRALFETTWPQFGPLLGVSSLTGLGVGLGFLLLVVPGVILFTHWSLSVPVVMLEGLSPRAAVRRSSELVRGRFWAVLCVLLNVGFRTVLVAIALRFAFFLSARRLARDARALARRDDRERAGHAVRRARDERRVLPTDRCGSLARRGTRRRRLDVGLGYALAR